jgi:hypothetical protein
MREQQLRLQARRFDRFFCQELRAFLDPFENRHAQILGGAAPSRNQKGGRHSAGNFDKASRKGRKGREVLSRRV